MSPGYVTTLQQERGLEDPVAFFTEQAREMNESEKRQREKRKARQIGASPERSCGYFPLKQVWNGLNLNGFLDLLQHSRGFGFSIARLLEGLIYARFIEPCSKLRTWAEVFPFLYEKYEFSYDQILTGLEFAGLQYEKIVQLMTHQIRSLYEISSARTFIDCTNYFFEIDKEDELRRKGPSKENRRDPIIGMGLMLDSNLLPIGMRLYPGNQSEKAVVRETIRDLKERGSIEGRTVQVADKGINCAENIFEALAGGDGYLFSKSVIMLSEVEKKWVLLPNDWVDITKNGEVRYRLKECIADFDYKYKDADTGAWKKFRITEKRVLTYNPALARKQTREINKEVEKAKRMSVSQAKRSEYGDSAKYVTFAAADDNGNQTDGKVTAELNQKKIDEDLKFAGYNLLVTSELNMSMTEVYDIYHGLWRIEETFRVLKTYLEARPVYLQKKHRIFGHFLVCYLGVALLRILQFFVLESDYESEQLIRFMQEFKVVQTPRDGWINLTNDSQMVRYMSSKFKTPLTSLFLTTQQLNALFTRKI